MKVEAMKGKKNGRKRQLKVEIIEGMNNYR